MITLDTAKPSILETLFVQLTQDMGIEPPIPVSAKLGDFNTIFRRIVAAAEHPHLSIPETEAGRSRKQYSRLINRSLMVVSGMPIFSPSCVPVLVYQVLIFCFLSSQLELQLPLLDWQLTVSMQQERVPQVKG